MQERSLPEYVNHYHRERNHQGVGNQLITPVATRPHAAQPTVRWPRLGGILNFYQRVAA
jgi:putative transposase